MRTAFENHENAIANIAIPAPETSAGNNQYSNNNCNGISELRGKFKHLSDCFLKGISPEPPATQTDILDNYFQESFARSNTGVELNPVNNPYAIIARGNYGRKEICSQHEVTILFIFSTTIPEKADGLIKDIIYPLWDLNLKITYSIRTIEECITDARKNYTYLLSVLDSRFVCGASLLFSQLLNTIRGKIVFSKKKEIAGWQFEEDKKRHLDYGAAEFLLEPDLIYSTGGLKDLHSILSIARSNMNIIEQTELNQAKLISTNNYETLVSSIEYIRKVVRFLNITNGRSRLLVKHQKAVANFMEYTCTKSETATDLFLSDLYRHMNNLRKIHNQFFLFASPKSFAIKKNSTSGTQNTPNWIFKAKGLISFKSSKKITKNPLRLLEIFIESERHDMPLNSDALRLINDHHHLLSSSATDSEKACELLEKNLFFSNVNSAVPFALLDSEILTTLIPELLYAVNKKKAGYYNFHPFCHHLLLTLNHLKELLSGNKEIKTGSLDAVFSPDCHHSIFWAALLQGLENNSIKNILTRFGKAPDIIKNVCFLTENYDLLYSIISYENIYAERTIKTCGVKAGSYLNLNRLYFLTIADMRAKSSLACRTHNLEDLDRVYHSVIESRFKEQETTGDSESKKKILLELCRFYNIGNAEALISAINLKSYHQSFSPDELLLHLRLTNKTRDGELTSFSETTGSFRKITILSKKANYNLQDISGILLENKINIYDYRYYPISENTTVHAFRVEQHPDIVFENEKWIRINKRLTTNPEHKLQPEFNSRTDLYGKEEQLFNHDVKIKRTKTDEESMFMIELVTQDSPAMLYQLISRLSADGTDIVFFRKTNESCGCLHIFKIVDRTDRLNNTEFKKKYTKKLLGMVINGE